MLKRIFLFFLITIISSSCQDDYRDITIRVKSQNLDLSSKIYIVGNEKELGNWNPKLIELNKHNGYWERTFNFKLGQVIEYKFTLGSWETEALDDENIIPDNYSFLVNQDTIISHEIKNWKKADYKEGSMGQITGTLIYHNQLHFEGILPRDICVWLPPDYNTDTTRKFPVLYMNDGQNLFDPNTSFTNIDWQIDEAADSLIRKDKIKSIIIVGINNTADRSIEYSLTEKGITYMKFIINKVKPFIDSKYRTLIDKQNNAIGGSSSGGLASFLLAWNYPKYFSKVICYSPAFKYENFDLTEIVEEYSGTKKDITVYIYNGGKGVDSMLQVGVDKISNFLLKKGYVENNDLYISVDTTATHNEEAWARHIPITLETLFGK